MKEKLKETTAQHVLSMHTYLFYKNLTSIIYSVLWLEKKNVGVFHCKHVWKEN